MATRLNPAGMAWAEKVNVTDIVDAYGDDEIPFDVFRDEFVKRLRALPMYERRVTASVVARDHDDFVSIVAGMEQSDDEDEFQGYLNDLYDWGDVRKRLWIETFG